MTHNQKYWLFQGVGWSLFLLFSTYIALLVQELSQKVMLTNLFMAIGGLLITHFYRNYILNHRWMSLKTEKILLYGTCCVLALSAIYLLYYEILVWLFHKDLFHAITLKKLSSSFVSCCLVFGLWNMLYFGWQYLEKNRRTLIQNLTMESAMKDLELKTLRANLQPHFIFNALNSIRALVDENPNEARNAITKISNILRSTISKQTPTDTVQHEAALVEDYLHLEKIRYEERLTYSITLQEASKQLPLPTFMLQTLVENAIKHGIAMQDQGGHIDISTALENDSLIVVVKNSGRLPDQKQHPDSLGFGLEATRTRLQYLYGERATFSLESKANQVIATIKIHHPNNINT